MTARVPSLSHGEPYGTIPLWCKGGKRLQENIIVKPSVEKQVDRFLRQGRALFFSAPCGFGKTAVAEALLSGREVLRLSADSADFSLPSAEADWQILLLDDLQDMQEEQVPNIRRRKPIRVQIPVNLRSLFPSRTLRNFALYTTPEIDPRLGRYEFGEICQAVTHRMGLDVTPKIMSSRIATNVSSERLMPIRVMPLFLKNLVMKAVFDAVGEKTACLCISNLGRVTLPEAMTPYVKRMDFILSTQATAPQNCSVLSYGDDLYVNFVRNIREPELESHFFRVLRDMGLGAEVQTNARQ